MANSKILNASRSWLNSIGAAIAVSGALASHHRPSDTQLRGAGIDPKAFREIKGL